MPKNILFYTLVTLLLITQACGSQSQSQSLSVKSKVKKEVVVALMGGFNSCPDKSLLDKVMRAGKTAQMTEHFKQSNISQALKDKGYKKIHYFKSCYTGPNDILKEDDYGKITGRFRWGAKTLTKKSKSVESFDIPQGKSLKDIAFLDDMKSAITEFIQKKKKSGIHVDLYIFGHSYGGFTAIQIADAFVEETQALVTTDPISMMTCQARDMVTNIYKTLTRSLPGCQQAPYDRFSLESIQKLKKHMTDSSSKKWWLNFYQKSFPWLRSGLIAAYPMKYPVNHLVEKDEFKGFFSGAHHSQMARNDFVWDKIDEKFTQKPEKQQRP